MIATEPVLKNQTGSGNDYQANGFPKGTFDISYAFNKMKLQNMI